MTIGLQTNQIAVSKFQAMRFLSEKVHFWCATYLLNSFMYFFFFVVFVFEKGKTFITFTRLLSFGWLVTSYHYHVPIKSTANLCFLTGWWLLILFCLLSSFFVHLSLSLSNITFLWATQKPKKSFCCAYILTLILADSNLFIHSEPFSL